MLDVVVDYTYALDTLDRYDYQELKIEDTTSKEVVHATYENTMKVIRASFPYRSFEWFHERRYAQTRTRCYF